MEHSTKTYQNIEMKFHEIPLFCGFGQGQGISSQERPLSNFCFAIRKDECCGTAVRQGPPTNVDKNWFQDQICRTENNPLSDFLWFQVLGSQDHTTVIRCPPGIRFRADTH